MDEGSLEAVEEIAGTTEVVVPALLGRVEKQLARFPLARLTTVGPRTISWAARTLSERGGDLPGMPRIRMSAALAAHVAVDESLMALFTTPNKFPRRADYERVGREVAEAADLFEARGYLDDPRSYHGDPPPLVDVRQRDGWAMGERFRVLDWDSGYEPPDDVPGRDRWLSLDANRRAAAWVMEHRTPGRPWLVLVHGFGMGTPFLDLLGFRAGHLHRELGCNLAAIVLPGHGSRGTTALSGEDFLSFEMMNSVHGLAHSVWDIRRLISWIRLRSRGDIGVMGVSLGGYLTALVAAFEPDLAAVVAGIPVSDFPALYRQHSPRHVQLRAIEHGILDGTASRVHRVVSPLTMSPLVEPAGRFIFAGLGDRMAVPEQAHRLWEHWAGPDICWYPGNHVGYLWSPKVSEFVDHSLSRRGLTHHL